MPNVGTASLDLEIDAAKLGTNITAAVSKQTASVEAASTKLGAAGGASMGAGMGSSLKSSFTGTLGALGADRAIQAGFAFIGDSLAEGIEKIKIDARITTLVKNAATIGSTVSKGAFDSIGAELAKQLVVDDDDVKAGLAPLLNIPNLTEPAFKRLGQLVTDTSAATGKSMDTVATAISRIGQAPDEAARSLRTLGVVIDDETMSIVQHLTDQGKTAEAAAILIGKLEERYKGAGQAAGDAAGPQQKFGVALDDVKEKIGVALLPVLEQLTPLLITTADLFGKVLPPLLTALGPLLTFVGNNADAMVAAFLPLAGVVGAAQAAFEEFGPVVRAIMAEVVDKFLAGVEWIVRGAATAFAWVPGVGPKLREAARAIEGFRDDANEALNGVAKDPIVVKVDTSGARASIAQLRSELASLNAASESAGPGGGNRAAANAVEAEIAEQESSGGGDQTENLPDRAHGLDEGPLPGRLGEPMLVRAHAGEWVVTPEQMEDLTSGRSGGSTALGPTAAEIAAALIAAFDARPPRAYVVASDVAKGLHDGRRL